MMTSNDACEVDLNFYTSALWCSNFKGLLLRSQLVVFLFMYKANKDLSYLFVSLPSYASLLLLRSD